MIILLQWKPLLMILSWILIYSKGLLLWLNLLKLVWGIILLFLSQIFFFNHWVLVVILLVLTILVHLLNLIVVLSVLNRTQLIILSAFNRRGYDALLPHWKFNFLLKFVLFVHTNFGFLYSNKCQKLIKVTYLFFVMLHLHFSIHKFSIHVLPLLSNFLISVRSLLQLIIVKFLFLLVVVLF